MSSSAVSTHPTGWSIALGVLLIVFGVFATIAPLFAGIVASLFFGWLILLGAVAHFTYAWSERGAGAVAWQALIGFAYLVAAFWIFLHPVGGVVALTLVLACYIAAEGVLELAFFGVVRSLPGASWFLVDGVISLLLACLIFLHWPSSSAWVVGTLVGISFLFSGIARLTMPVYRRRMMLLEI